jgi:hypothetical protein
MQRLTEQDAYLALATDSILAERGPLVGRSCVADRHYLTKSPCDQNPVLPIQTYLVREGEGTPRCRESAETRQTRRLVLQRDVRSG